MSTKALLSELDVELSREEREQCFDEILHVTKNYARNLGKELAPAEQPVDLVQAAERLKEDFQRTVVEFSPVLEVYPLGEQDLAGRGIELPPQVQTLLKKSRFCLVRVPVLMVPEPGWGFTDLDCIVEFNPGQDALLRPAAYRVFPKEEWETVMRASQGLSVGLTETFEFKAIGVLPGTQGSTGLVVDAGANLALGPYSYEIRRPKVIARGQGSPKVRWQFQGEASAGREELQLSIVLQVPRRAKTIQAIGVLKASAAFHTFTAHLRYLAGLLRDRTRRFFEQGMPITDECTWDMTRLV
jgi:hypothetical protein